MITQERLKEVLDYNKNTGLFRWKSYKNSLAKAGGMAGTKNHGYIKIKVDGLFYMAHRLAWFYVTGSWPKDQIDHINHVRDDNRFSNFREATNTINQRNCAKSINNTSGIVGVSWHKKDKRWQSVIKVKYKLLYLGQYKDINAAILTRKVAEHAYGFHPNHGKTKETLEQIEQEMK